MRDYEFEKYMLHELKVMNKHLPQKRKSLLTLLQEEIPHVVCLDGTQHVFKRGELIFIKSLLSETEIKELLLPIIIEPRPDLGEGTYIISDRLGAKVVAKILNLEKYNVPLLIYKPQLAIIRSKLPTTTQYAFTYTLLNAR